jgi:acyl carrier protein
MIRTKLLAIINRMLENKDESLLPSLEDSLSLRKNLGFDSLDLAEFTVHIESEFGVDVFEDGIVNTVSEVIQRITNGKK